MSLARKNFSFLFVGNLIYTVCQWGMLVVYAKFGSPLVVGQFALATAVLTPILMFTNLQLRALQSTDAANKYTLDDFMAVRLISLGIFFAVAASVGVGFYRQDGMLPVLAVLALTKAVEALNDVLYGYFQKHERMEFIARSLAFRGIFSLAVLAAAFYCSKDLTISLAALCVTWAGRMLFDFLWLARFEAGRFAYRSVGDFYGRVLHACRTRKAVLKEILKNGAYLGVVMGLVSLNGNTPRYIVDRFLGPRELGFFSAMAYASVAINMFVLSVGNALSPRFAKHFMEGDVRGFFKIMFRGLAAVLACGAFGLIVTFFFGSELLTIAYTEEYAAYQSVFLLIVLAAVVSSMASILGFAMTAVKIYAEQIPVFIIILITNVALCYSLTPRFGLAGAAWGMVISFVLQFVLSLGVIGRKMAALHGNGKNLSYGKVQ